MQPNSPSQEFIAAALRSIDASTGQNMRPEVNTAYILQAVAWALLYVGKILDERLPRVG